MNSEKRRIIQQKLKEFLSMLPEEKHAIDENSKYDGLFSIIQEMSDIVASSHEYKIFLEYCNNIPLLHFDIDVARNYNVTYLPKSGVENIYIDGDFPQYTNEDYEYSWAA